MATLRSQSLQYLAAITVSILTLMVGFNVSWPSPMIPLLTSENSPIGVQLDEVDQESWVTSISMLGVLIVNLYFGQLQDIFGRKGILLMSTVPNIAAWLMLSFANSYEMLLAARFINGLANVFPTMTSAVYIGEISEPSIRGRLGMFNLCMIETGSVLITIVGSYTSYLATNLMPVVVCIIFIITFVWMPESPYYHLRKGQVDKARECLKRLRVNTDVEKELVELQSSVEREMKEKSNIWELVRVPKYRQAVLVGLGLKTLQQMSGTIAINSYNKVIFEKVSTGMDSSVSAIISTSVAIPAVLIGSLLVDKLGRKPLYSLSTIGCAISLVFEFVYFFMKDYQEADVSSIGWLPVTGIILFNIFRTIGIQTLPYIILSEIFPSNMKALGLNVILMYSGALAFLVQFAFPRIEDIWGIYTCFGIFVVFCLLGLLFIIFFLPETKGKSLADIQNKIEREVQKTDKSQEIHERF